MLFYNKILINNFFTNHRVTVKNYLSQSDAVVKSVISNTSESYKQ